MCHGAIDTAEQKAQILLAQAECRISFECDYFLYIAGFALLSLAEIGNLAMSSVCLLDFEASGAINRSSSLKSLCTIEI